MSGISRKASSFTESVIREMTRLAVANGAVNLAQGFPDFAAPAELKEAAKAAIDADVNQYAITWGAREFREAIAAKTTRFHPTWRVDPETDVTVVCGATEGMIAAMLAILDPGDEVVLLEPYYPQHVGKVELAGGRIVLAPLDAANGFAIRADLIADRMGQYASGSAPEMLQQARDLFGLSLELDMPYLERRIREETMGDHGIDDLR